MLKGKTTFSPSENLNINLILAVLIQKALYNYTIINYASRGTVISLISTSIRRINDTIRPTEII